MRTSFKSTSTLIIKTIVVFGELWEVFCSFSYPRHWLSWLIAFNFLSIIHLLQQCWCWRESSWGGAEEAQWSRSESLNGLYEIARPDSASRNEMAVIARLCRTFHFIWFMNASVSLCKLIKEAFAINLIMMSTFIKTQKIVLTSVSFTQFRVLMSLLRCSLVTRSSSVTPTSW